MEGKDKNKIYPSRIPNHLWLYRQKRGYSQKQVALLLGHKSASHVSDYERGKRLPNLKTVLKLAVIFSTSVDLLFEEMRKELQGEIQPKREKILAGQYE